MKTFRLVVVLRLAFFPLIFNLTFAGEVEVSAENYEKISPTPLYQEGKNSQENENSSSLIKEEDYEVVDDLQNESDTPMDPHASFHSAQDDENSQDF